MGKLIVLEGTDGVGKSTQFTLLLERLQKAAIPCRTVVFPQYREPSSALIRMYLGGEFGTKPSDVNAYAASMFYAVDRYASWKKDWKNDYDEGTLIVCDRYTTSNAVHQASKEPPEQRQAYYRWLYETEFDLLGLPKPDLVIYLDAPIELTESMMRKREAQTNTNADIHEKDLAYLHLCRASGREAAEFYGWKIINCTNDGAMRTREDIHEEVYRLVAKCLEE